MKLIDLIERRIPPPPPWSEGGKIPWNEPDFSRRMLNEHLSQAHDAASRRFEIIAEQANWIHTHLLQGNPTRILDLGCGPGFYTSRLAALGHDCTGIDFSPASIEYARATLAENSACRYRLEDIRQAEFGTGFGLVMLIYGELNVFTRAEVGRIFARSRAALAPQGTLLLEVSTFEAVQRLGHQPQRWFGAQKGLFGDAPHLVLSESFWDEQAALSTERYYVIDPGSGEVTPMLSCTQAYTIEQYRELLLENGFQSVTFFPSLVGREDGRQTDFMAIVAKA